MKIRMKHFFPIIWFVCVLILTAILFVWNCRKIRTQEPTGQIFNIHCFDIGKADAFFIYGADTSILIDTGLAETSKVIIDYLKQKNIREIDLLVITHFDNDHMGGAGALLENFTVKKIVHTAFMKKKPQNELLMQKIRELQIKVEIPKNPMKFCQKGLSITIYPPITPEFKVSPDNNSSLICMLKFGKNNLMFTGDAEKERMHEFFALQYQGESNVFLKVPKHGTKNKPVKEIYRHFVPQAAVITSSDDLPESEKVIDFMCKHGTHVFLTRQGTIDIHFDERKMIIEQSGQRIDPRAPRKVVSPLVR